MGEKKKSVRPLRARRTQKVNRGDIPTASKAINQRDGSGHVQGATIRYRILFTGGTKFQLFDGNDCVVGAAGELRLFERCEGGFKLTSIIGPGQWRYVTIGTLPKAEPVSTEYALAVPEANHG